MNGVFAEECGGLLPGQRAGVSPQPADLSTAAVFMLRLVPQLSLPVVLPVFLFPNSSSHSSWCPPSSYSSHFSMEPSLSFRIWYVQRTCHRVDFLALSLLTHSKICRVGWLHKSRCDAQCTQANLKTLLRIHLRSRQLFFHSGPRTMSYKLSMHTLFYIINCEVMTAQYSTHLTSH